MFKNLFGRSGSNAVAQLSVAELKRRLDARDALQLIDVRSPEEFQHDGHIAGARLIPLPALAMRLSEISRETPVAIICRSGNRSQVAADMLAQQGYTEISNVQGGMIAWTRSGYTSKRG